MNKARKLVVLLTVALMVLALVPGMILAEADEDRVEFNIGETAFTVNGEKDEMDVAPFIRDGRTFIPVRFLAEALGAEADYEPKDATVETVTLDREDRLVTIEIGEYALMVLDKETGEEDPVILDAAALIEQGRTFLPFRAIAEAFGAEVDYDVDDDGLVTQVWFTQEAVEPDPDPGPVCAENSSVTFEDQKDGSAIATLVVQDEDGIGISGFGMDDIEVLAAHLEEWLSLTDLYEGEFVEISEFTDYGDGTYSYRIVRVPGEVILSYKVDGVVIETDLVTVISEPEESYPVNFYVMDDTTLQYPGPIDGAAVLVYEDEDLTVEVAELTTDEDGLTQTELTDGDYWFTVTAADHPDYEGNFTVEGQEEHVFVGMDE